MIRRLMFRLGRWLMRPGDPNTLLSEKTAGPYHLDAESQAAGFNSELRRRLEKAAEDFEASAAGLYPIHAARQGGFLDGGTTIWQGDGYSLTVMKSMTTVGEVAGYMFGPVLKLEFPLAHGNTTEVSHVTFYTAEALERLLG